MFKLLVLFALSTVAHFAPSPANSSDGKWIRQNPSDDRFLGLSWDAAVAAVNKHQTGKYLVPKKVLEAKTTKGSGQTEMVVIFQESWCSPQVYSALKTFA
ncbi:hypothetical protein OESDEN_13433 [Oesophagostomum dentatum]|uniref:Cystatin domain-containing protein n=1 Tax=Oesophagostomum dentatum TaxID=61180 RepID=A0A0B1STE9_OESDE|nr:hypothetical protein OESDEN_13433 [Oesophagostomum dentatum]